MDHIILASASPRRTDLLTQAGILHKVVPGSLDEDNVLLEGKPEENAIKLAYLKASEVSAGLDSGLVLGADTIVVLDDVTYGKPRSSEDAFEMLSSLSGRCHSVITGIAVVDAGSGLYKTAYESTRVKFLQLTEDEIQTYIATGEPFGKAGAYAVQGRGALFVEGVEGSYDNVVGLPLMKLRKLLEEFGISLNDLWE